MTEGERLALPYLFEFWAHPHQLPPEGDWRTWVILGGRGAGKTRAGAEWVRAQVEGAKPLDAGRCRRIALIGETYDQAREVMIYGESGILSCSPPDRKPRHNATRRTLVWPNGAEAVLFSAQDPEALRGPQFDGAWVDEFAKWKRARDVWDMLQFGLRLGASPRVCVTTTPRNVNVLKELMELPSTVSTHAKTEANRAHLAKSFLEEVRARYAGSSLGRQELDGVLLEQVDGALWTRAMFDTGRSGRVPDLDRIVVAVDPPAGGGKRSDACGIVVAGIVEAEDPRERRVYVLEDASVQGLGPTGWATAAVRAAERWQADRVVAEVNQGGAMVEATLRQIAPDLPFKAVHATRGKTLRAEPVAALYEQGRVFHGRGLEALEAQMCLMTPQGYEGSGSPDRVDALVWALTELMLGVRPARRVPQMRVI
ncbi:DNA-packaging protein [Maliponia aquimaris]|uniref:Terminase-like family protein n=1 Tax=Maliponia aquimaris TaxID=1673631 RepID=A0A238K1E7_9RHOB|nr:terminase family protein [Maliponia aquimaris]SMX36720.1 Terminase-like family protein [Maliponia aquimaris]